MCEGPANDGAFMVDRVSSLYAGFVLFAALMLRGGRCIHTELKNCFPDRVLAVMFFATWLRRCQSRSDLPQIIGSVKSINR